MKSSDLNSLVPMNLKIESWNVKKYFFFAENETCCQQKVNEVPLDEKTEISDLQDIRLATLNLILNWLDKLVPNNR